MFFSSIETVAAVFITLGIGLFGCRKGWITSSSKDFMTKILVNLCMPVIAVINILDKFEREMLSDIWLMLLIPSLVQAACVLISFLIAKILKLTPKREALFINMCTLSNAIFVGMPVCVGIFGEKSTPFVMIYYIVNTIFFWGYSAPNILMTAEGKKPPLKERLKKTVSVPLAACIAAFILLLFDFRLPSIVLTVFGFFSNCVTPLSLLLISRIIYEKGVKNIRFDLSITIILIMRFVLAPALMFFSAQAAGLDNLTAQVFTVQTAMPVMITTAVLAEAYRSDAEYATSGLVITTLLSLMSIPAYIFLMN